MDDAECNAIEYVILQVFSPIKAVLHVEDANLDVVIAIKNELIAEAKRLEKLINDYREKE